jgi:hypothetical protein
MPQVTIPTNVMPAVTQALGEAAVGLSDKQAAALFVQNAIRPYMRTVERRTGASSAISLLDTAIDEKQVALAAATQGRKDAEATADIAAEAKVTSVS